MAKRIPSLNWLRVFEAAARSGSFASAGERLAMSRPAVSQQIRALEQHLGQPLFEREAAGVKLTEAGRSLLSVVAESLGRMESAADAIAEPGGPPLIVGVSKTLQVGWLAPRLTRFFEKNPDVSIEMHSLVGRPETPPRNAMIWIAFGQPPLGTKSIPMFGERLTPVAHPDLAKKITSIEDLLNYPLIEVADHMKNWVNVLGGETRPKGAHIIYVDTTLAALAIAGARGGVALARPPATDDLIERYDLAPCLPELEVAGVENYYVIHNENARLTPAASAFLRWVKSESRKD